jgi:hypothetical protein
MILFLSHTVLRAIFRIYRLYLKKKVVAEILVCRLYLQYIPNSVRTWDLLGLGHEIEFKYFDKNGYFFVSKGTSRFGTIKMSLRGLCFAMFHAVKGTGSRDIIKLFLPNLDSSRFSYFLSY